MNRIKTPDSIRFVGKSKGMGFMSHVYDYKNQAWVENGVYIRCGHPESMDCGCYGRLHAGEPVNHQQDSDCDVDAYGTCVLCLVDHTAECPDCGGRGFHQYECVAISPALAVAPRGWDHVDA
jgi:hypothetical protein